MGRFISGGFKQNATATLEPELEKLKGRFISGGTKSATTSKPFTGKAIDEEPTLRAMTPEIKARLRAPTIPEEERMRRYFLKSRDIKRDVLGEFAEKHPLFPAIAPVAPVFTGVSLALEQLPRVSQIKPIQQLISKLPQKATTELSDLGILGAASLRAMRGEPITIERKPQEEAATLMNVVQSLAEWVVAGKIESAASQKIVENTLKTLGGKLTEAGYGVGRIEIPKEAIERVGKYTPTGEAILQNINARTLRIPARPPEVITKPSVATPIEKGKEMAAFTGKAIIAPEAPQPIAPPLTPPPASITQPEPISKGKQGIVVEGYRFENKGVERGDVAFFSREKDYPEELQELRKERGVEGEIKKEKIEFKNPLIVTAEMKNFADPYYERQIIEEAKKQGYDGVVFKSSDGSDEFYVKLFQPKGEGEIFKVTSDEFEKGIIGYINKAKSMPLKEIRELTGQLVEKGLLSKDALKEFKELQMIEGVKGTEIEAPQRLNIIAQFAQLKSTAHFAYAYKIQEMLLEGKPVSQEAIDSVKSAWIEKDGTVTKSLKEAIESYGVKFNPDLIISQPKGEEKIAEEIIPQFKTTEEAFAFGRQATPEQIEALKAERETLEARKAELKKLDTDEADKEIVKIASGQGQFINEALKAHEQAKGEVEPTPVEQIPSAPSKEPPTTAISGEGDEAKERADFEQFMKAYKESETSLEQAIRELGGIKSYKFGKEAEELRGIPLHLRNNAGQTLDELVSQLQRYGYHFEDANELAQALQEKPKVSYKKLSPEIKEYLKQAKALERTNKKQALQTYQRIARTLAQQMPASQVKKQIRQETGQVKFTGKAIPEPQALKRSLKRQEQAAKKAFSAGKQWSREARSLKHWGAQITPEEKKEIYLEAYKKGLILEEEGEKDLSKVYGIIKRFPKATGSQIKAYISQLTGEPGNPARIFKLFGDIEKDTEVMRILNKVSKKWQDILSVEIFSLDPARIIEQVTGQNIWGDAQDTNILADNTFIIWEHADDELFKELSKELSDLETNRQGIKKGSKESAEVMRKSEVNEPLTEKEQKVADYLRRKFDYWIKRRNDTLVPLGYKPIPYRQEYWTHIPEVSLLNEFFKYDPNNAKNVTFEQLDAIRNSDYTKGNKPFNKFALQRKGQKTKYDAIGNYEIYLRTILKEIHYTPAIKHARTFIKYALINQPNAYIALDRKLNTLKGKSTDKQNMLELMFGNRIVQKLNARISNNYLIANINFWLTNMSNFSVSFDELGNWMTKGMEKFLSNKEWRKFAFENSVMLRNRTIDPEIDPSTFNTVKEVASYVTNLLEYNNVGSTWTGAYLKATEELNYSQPKAVEYADAIARRTQAGYKKYETNTYMDTNVGKVLSKFQNWSFNMMNHVLYDLGVKNIPVQAWKRFTGKKPEPRDKVRWQAFFILLATSMLVNWIYKKAGLRPPYQARSFVPGVPFITRSRYEEPPLVSMGYSAKQIFTGKKPETRQKAMRRLATGLLLPFGGVQVGRFMEGTILPRQEQKEEETSRFTGRAFTPRLPKRKFKRKFRKKFRKKFRSKF